MVLLREAISGRTDVLLGQKKLNPIGEFYYSAI
jgi:hypothetical protein